MGDPSDEWRLWKRQDLPVKSDSVSDIDNLSDDSEEDTMFTSCISNIYPNVGGTNTPQGDSPTDPLASSAASICSLESIVTFFKKHFNEFQNCFNDSWTMRETNFCQKSLSNMSDTVEKMDRFDQRYHQFVTNFNGHMLEILQLNVESLLLSMKAFIQCCGSLQYSKHNSGVALYPDELIQTMKVLIEQSIRAVNTAWLTFLQSTNCQIEEFPIDHAWSQSLSSECATEFEQNDTMTYNLNEKDNVSPYKYTRKELFNEETIMKEPESEMNLCTENAEPSSNVTSDTSQIYVERLGPQNFQPSQNKENTESVPRKGDCFNSQPTLALKECSVTLENCDTYNLRHTPNIQQGTVLNNIWDGASPEIHDHAFPQNRNVTEQRLLNTDKRTSLSKPEEIRISKKLLASSENKFKTGKHKRKPWSKSPNKTPTKKPTLESLPMESLTTPCTDRGTQTPSKLSALRTSSTAAPRGNTITHNKNLEKKRYSKSPPEILDKPKNKSRRLEQSQTRSSVNHKKTEYKDDANLSSTKDKLQLNQDHPLTTFVSSLKSYQCSPTSMHVSLQVACVERKVLARRLRIEEAKKQLEKKKSRQRSRKRPLDTRRSEKSDTSNENKSRKSLDENTSSTPQKRVKKTDDVVNKKNSKDNYSISNSSYHCADQHGKSEKDSNNNTTEQDVKNSNKLVPVNKQNYKPVISHQNCVNKCYKKQSRRQIGALMLLEDEDQFFLNQQADLTARIKSMRKMKVSSGENLPSSTPNHADDINKQPQKYSDPNNNVKSS